MCAVFLARGGAALQIPFSTPSKIISSYRTMSCVSAVVVQELEHYDG